MNIVRRVFRKITPAEMAAKELADAELSILEALTAKEYADSVISYNTARIGRLCKFLSALQTEAQRNE